MKILKMFFYYQFYFFIYFLKIQHYIAVNYSSVMQFPIYFTLIYFFTCSYISSVLEALFLTILNMIILFFIENLWGIDKEKVVSKIENCDKEVLRKAKIFFKCYLAVFCICLTFLFVLGFTDIKFCLMN